MFEQTQSSVLINWLNHEEVDEPLDIRAILETCKFLPTVVTQASLTMVVERLVDQELLSSLTSDVSCPNSSSEWDGRRERREAALSRYLGQVLICVFIRLPGIHYTIEIDPQKRSVIHCEWQEI